MQPEITREWLAEQLALCEKASVGDWEEFFDYERAAKEHYPLLLRKLMEAMDETPIDEAWLRSLSPCKPVPTAIGNCYRFPIDETKSLTVWERACGVGFTATLRVVRRDEQDRRCTTFIDLRDVTTRAAVLALLAAMGVGAKGG